MRAAWAWATAEWRARWKELLALAVLLGLLAATAMTALAGARRTVSSFDRFRDAALSHDVLATAHRDDAANLRRIADLPEVVAASTGDLFPAFVDVESEFDLGIIVPTDANLGRTVNRGVVVEGRWPRSDRRDEVAVNELAAEQLGAHSGSMVELSTLTPEQIATIAEGLTGGPAGPTLRLRVVGVVRNADDLLSDAASSIIFGTPAFSDAYRDRVGSFAAFGAYRLADGVSVDDFATRARPTVGTEGDASLMSSDDNDEAVHDALRFLATGLAIVGLIALVVGLVAGGQAIARQVALTEPDQHPLAALGLTRADRTIGNTLVGAPVAVLAAVVAAGAALVASPLTPINIARQVEPDPGLRWDVVHLVGGVATLGLVVLGIVAAAWRVAALREATAQDRIRPSIGARVSRALALGAGPTTGVRMALERGAGRTAVPVRSALVAAVVAVMGIAAATTFATSLERLTTSPARYGKPWHLMPDWVEGAEPRWAAEADVAEAGLLRSAAVVIEGRGASGYAIRSAKGSPQPTILTGRPPADDGEAAVGSDLLAALGRRAGDTVDLERAAGGVRTVRVVGTFLSPAIDQDRLAGGVLLTATALEEVAQSDIGDQGIIAWRRGVDPDAAEARFKARFPEARTAYATPRPPGEVVNIARVDSLAPVVALFCAAVGTAALLHLLATSIRRRRRDLAVLRAVGFVRRQVVAAIVGQAATVGLVGLIVGVPLGAAAGRWSWIVTAEQIGVANDPLVPVGMGFVLAAMVLAAAVAVGAPLGWRAARRRPAAALRTE